MIPCPTQVEKGPLEALQTPPSSRVSSYARPKVTALVSPLRQTGRADVRRRHINRKAPRLAARRSELEARRPSRDPRRRLHAVPDQNLDDLLDRGPQMECLRSPRQRGGAVAVVDLLHEDEDVAGVEEDRVADAPCRVRELDDDAAVAVFGRGVRVEEG